MKKLFLRFLRKTGVLKFITLIQSVKVGQKTFRVPVINEMGMEDAYSISEPWMYSVIHKLLKLLSHHHPVFLDVGVNLGQTLLKVKAIDFEINYIGFEPNPTCIYYLNELISINKLRRVKILPVALNDQTGLVELNFFTDSPTDSSASIIPGLRTKSTTRSEYIAAFRFDELAIEENEKIGLIKIDVEGAELQVLLSLQSRLAKDRSVVIIEILPVYNAENSIRLQRQLAIQRILEEIDYSIFRILKNNGELSGVVKLNEFGIHSDLEQCDYLLCPSELDDRLTHNTF